MNKNCIVISTSVNPAKTIAINRAFSKLCTPNIVEIATGTLLRVKQPAGFRETLCCALSRAFIAKEKDQRYDFIASIEAGLLDTPSSILEGQIAVVVDRNERVSLGTSPLFPLPRHWLSEILREGKELEEVAERELGLRSIGEKIGVIGVLTNGLITRTDLSYLATLSALLPWLNPRLYKVLPSFEQVLEDINCSPAQCISDNEKK